MTHPVRRVQIAASAAARSSTGDYVTNRIAAWIARTSPGLASDAVVNRSGGEEKKIVFPRIGPSYHCSSCFKTVQSSKGRLPEAVSLDRLYETPLPPVGRARTATKTYHISRLALGNCDARLGHSSSPGLNLHGKFFFFRSSRVRNEFHAGGSRGGRDGRGLSHTSQSSCRAIYLESPRRGAQLRSSPRFPEKTLGVEGVFRFF